MGRPSLALERLKSAEWGLRCRHSAAGLAPCASPAAATSAHRRPHFQIAVPWGLPLRRRPGRCPPSDAHHQRCCFRRRHCRYNWCRRSRYGRVLTNSSLSSAMCFAARSTLRNALSAMAKTDQQKTWLFKKVVQVFLSTPHQPHKPTGKKAKVPGRSAFCRARQAKNRALNWRFDLILV